MKQSNGFFGESQMSLFAAPQEKGRGEWSAFNSIREDTSGAYRVRIPQKPIVIHGAQHLLRIIYPRLGVAH